MAKIFKVSGYFVDANGVVDKEKFEDKLESLEDLFPHHLHVEEADIGEWDDENPLNYDNCDLADCEKDLQAFQGAYGESLAYCTGHRSTGTILCSIRMRGWSYLEQALRNVRKRSRSCEISKCAAEIQI